MSRLCTIFLYLLLAGCSRGSTPFSETTPPLRAGDMLFRLGVSHQSRAVNVMDRHSSYSHVGIIAQSEGSLLIVHAVPDERPNGGVDSIRIDSIENFFSSGRAEQCLIVRYPLTDSIAERVGNWALREYQRGTLFDNYFNTDDTSALYCTELIHYAFLSEGIDLSEGRRHNIPAFHSPMILPSDILECKDLDEIYYFRWK